IDAEVLRTGNAFGTWRAAGDARRALESMAREKRCSLRLLALEQAPVSCFGYQVGRCAGACVGREPPSIHMTRIKLALMSQRLVARAPTGPVGRAEGTGR